MIALRDYQEEIVSTVRNRMKAGVRSLLVQAPTGSGKTLLTAFMLKTAASKGLTSWFVLHRRELCKQSILAFDSVGMRFGVAANGFPEDPRQLVQICSVQSLAKRWHKMTRPKLIVWDECHHMAAASWDTLHRSQPQAFHIGLTATPERLDGTGLEKYFTEMIKGPSVEWLIQNKFLSPYRLYAPASISTEGIHTRMGDFSKAELNVAADKPTITGNAIREYSKLGAGKRAVVFCVSVEHSKHVVSQFQAAGIPAAHVDGETDVSERDAAIKKFETGEILVLSNVELFGEGFNLPAIEVAILLRPTQSLGLYLQQVGRSLRPAPGKNEAIILDHAGNVSRHGLPDDERDWSLAGRSGRKSSADGTAASVRVCPGCFAAQFAGATVCKFCGLAFELKPREVEQVDGDLTEVDKEAMRRVARQQQGRAQTVSELAEIGKQRGYKKPYAWASHIFRARQARKLAGTQ